MTVTNQLNRATLEGNGLATVVPISFPFHSAEALVVVQTVLATGTETTKILNTDYTVTGTPDAAGHYPNGGEVVFTAAPLSTVRMTVYRNPPILQGVVLQETGKIPVKAAIESPLDELTMISQRLSERVGRALQLSDGDTAALGRLLAKTVRASRYLGFDGDGNPTMMQTPTGMVTSLAQLAESTVAALPAAGAAGSLRKVTDGARGVWMVSGTVSSLTCHYNTIAIGFPTPITSSGTNFGASGIFIGSASPPFVASNNIVNVKATRTGTGTIAALRRVSGTSGTKPAGFNLSSNLWRCGTISATENYIYLEGTATFTNAFHIGGGSLGTNDASTFNTACGAYKSWMGDVAAFTEDSLVAGGTTGTWVPTSGSLAQNSAVTLSGITTDHAGITRNATTPDRGALEIAGTAAQDLVPPTFRRHRS